ncbi:MAG: TRAP transporter permease [Candidatus Rariloculaceae bacterium]
MSSSSSTTYREHATAVLAFSLALFHLLSVSGLLLVSTLVVRVFHLMIVLALVFLRVSDSESDSRSGRAAVNAVLVLASLVTGAYLLFRWEAIALSGGITNQLDIVMGTIVVVLVMEAARRTVGRVLALIASVFLIYPFISAYLPGLLNSRGIRFESFVGFLAHSGQGIYGIPLGVASTYIVLFTIFGSFLSEFGAGDFFFRLSNLVTKGFRAASAKTAVIFSTLLGMISGSAAGNVAVTGSFTIPLMKREGYRPHQAGAIEAVVSTGGQIMPPVMGAAAFIMAEIVGTPYVNIMKAGLIPALLFFVSVLFVVHLQAVKSDLAITEAEAVPLKSLTATIVGGAAFVIPFFTLIGMMIAGYSPVKASFFAIVLLLVVHLLFSRRINRELWQRIGRAMAGGVRNAIPISIACAAAGIISAVLSATGLGSKLSSFIISMSGGIPLIGLILTMITAIILGMGLPTTAAYLILATVVAPALADMGVPLLTAHMFVFFFGCVSTITPPVALASYVAAGVARADINQVGWTAFRFGLVCYLLPFAFFYGPALLGQGSVFEIVTTCLSGVAGVFFLATSIVGYFRMPLDGVGRSVTAAAGILLLNQGLVTDMAGALLIASWAMLLQRGK